MHIAVLRIDSDLSGMIFSRCRCLITEWCDQKYMPVMHGISETTFTSLHLQTLQG